MRTADLRKVISHSNHRASLW